MNEDRRSRESIELDRRPDLREQVSATAEFQEWRSGLKTFELDGERLFLLGGDVPAEHDQIVHHWARENGLI
jgi:hypothetical protein